ncbi:MAG: ROK family protein [Nitrososphaerota archaeon]
MPELVVGVDLGATRIRAALGSIRSGILRKIEEKTVRVESPEAVIQQFIRLIERVSADDLKSVRAIGIGSIGPLDFRKGIILSPPNVPFKNVPISEALRDKFKIPVYLLNDCTAAVLGEWIFGAGKGLKNLAYITLSSGIGGGAIVDGALLLGKDGNAAEIGHMVIDLEGRLACNCGGRGHWEAYCSGAGIPRFVKYLVESRPSNFHGSAIEELVVKGALTPKSLFDLARSGDEKALEIVGEIGRLNAIGFANINTLYDPELITVGGSIALNNRELVLEPIIANIGNYTVNRTPEIKITPLGDDVVLYGAIAMASNSLPILSSGGVERA